MKNIFMKNILAVCLLIVVSISNAFGNAAAPGFFNIGGGQSFTLLHPSDSTALKYIQMQSENIIVHIYKGFAVVKGEYFMYNHSDSVIDMHTGYPLNMYRERNDNYYIEFDMLYGFKVLINDSMATHGKFVDSLAGGYTRNTWYTWRTSFAPKTITKLTVYFVVNTNTAYARHGYNKDQTCGFAYIIETGGPWAGNIEKGSVYVELMDDLTINDVYSVLPDSSLLTDNKNKLLYSFTNLDATSSNNVLIRYGKQVRNFDANTLETRAPELYKTIDAQKVDVGNTSSFLIYKSLHKIDEVESSWGSKVMMLIFVLPVVGLLLLVFSIVLIVRAVRRNRKK